MEPKFSLDKIKFAVDDGTFQRAIGIYESGKIKDFKELYDGFRATVIGTDPYEVFVSSKKFSIGDCDCYVGRKEILCKHMVAVAIFALKNGEKLSLEDKEQHNEIKLSKRKGELTKEELSQIKKSITEACRYIKAYEGPSRIWFQYQDSLTEGGNRLRAIFSGLPVSKQTSDLIIKTLLKLDDKLCGGGVDDSDGTVGGFISDGVWLLEEFAKIDPDCIETFNALKNQSTCFGWEEDMVKLYDKRGRR